MLLPDEKTGSPARFLADTPAWFDAHGVAAERVMTDNGSAFKSKRFAAALRSRGPKHERTRPCTPRTSAEAERLIRTSLRDRACAARARAMPAWLRHHNSLWPHPAPGGRPPISRPARDDLLGGDS